MPARRALIVAAITVTRAVHIAGGSSRFGGASRLRVSSCLSAFAGVPGFTGSTCFVGSATSQVPPRLCVQPTVRAVRAMPPGMAIKKRKTQESHSAPSGKRGKHAHAPDDMDEADLVEIEENEGAGAFPAAKSSSYSAASDPETAKQEAAKIGIPEWQIKGALALLDEGSTVPFIARYRKEATGGMDENQLRALVTGLERRQKVGDRRAAIIESLSKAKQLTQALTKALQSATTLSELEDIYLPLRPKRKTRASDARAKGLEELATVLMGQLPAGFPAPPAGANPYQNGPSWLAADPTVTARRFLKHAADSGDGRAAGLTPEEALAGARDIAAQTWAEEPEVRKRAREPRFLRRALQVVSKERKKGADAEGNYVTYHEYSRGLHLVPPHAILALARGEREKILSIKLVHGEHEKGVLLGVMRKQLFERAAFALSAAWKEEVDAALRDGITRLLLPALEREWWKEALEAAEEASFQTFAVNLRARLLQPPVKGCPVLGIDPGLRTGCKAALVSPTGVVTDTLTFFPKAGGGSGDAARQLAEKVKEVSRDGQVLVALGNGKGSRDAEGFLRSDVTPLLPSSLEIKMAIMDEGGASVYSASELAGKELPGMDVTLRGAVSIARRLQDPLGELVKIEPKALGVGLYQHDVNQKRLAQELNNVVESAVNAVGVDVNTASPSLLQYIAGLNAKVAHELVEQREREGAFASRAAIKKVKGLGPKTFLQAAGFLRVYGSSEPLDATAIHPESYKAAKVALKEFALSEGAPALEAAQMAALRAKLKAAGVEVGDLTLADIVDSLRTAGRDPRETLLGVPPPILAPLTGARGSAGGGKGHEGAKEEGAGQRVSLDELVVGMTMQGVVRNVVAFGSFIDIGVQQDALLHVSQRPRGAPPLQVGQRLAVVVDKIDRPKAGAPGKTRISLKCA
jgi:uncharacterized protein